MKKIQTIMAMLIVLALIAGCGMSFQEKCVQNSGWTATEGKCSYGDETAQHYFKWNCNDGTSFIFYYDDVSEFHNYEMPNTLSGELRLKCPNLEEK
ncbi:hypothetical protein ACFL0W_05080 [Nanoarchaeota archaeon]